MSDFGLEEGRPLEEQPDSVLKGLLREIDRHSEPGPAAVKQKQSIEAILDSRMQSGAKNEDDGGLHCRV